MRIWLSMVIASMAVTASLPCFAYAAEKPGDAENTYALEFTLPTAGKSGCMVCHGDPNLVKVAGEATSTIYVEVEQLEQSAHDETVCTGCHLDFAYTAPHKGADDWNTVAKSACKNCKDHQPQFSEYTAGAHSPARRPGEDASATAAARRADGKPTKVPLCGDCHSGHTIPSKDDTAAIAVYRSRGMEVCGECHETDSLTYRDYYHGAAYQAGTADAPACWDCHGIHEILPADDRRSTVNERNLVETCGREGCHVNVDESFLAYAEFVHGRDELLAANPVWQVKNAIRTGIEGFFSTIASWFDRG